MTDVHRITILWLPATDEIELSGLLTPLDNLSAYDGDYVPAAAYDALAAENAGLRDEAERLKREDWDTDVERNEAAYRHLDTDEPGGG